MRVLAIDSSSRWGGLALVEGPSADGSCLAVLEIVLHMPSTHAAKIVGAVDAALALADWQRGSLDGFVATRGPGSFTGIRIGLGTVRGLGVAADRPAAGVSTLDALAEAHGPAESERWSLISAGRGEIFGARYTAASSPAVPTGGPWLLSLDRWSKRIPEGAAAVAIPGPGTAAVLSDSGSLPSGVRLAAAPTGLAAAAARLAVATRLLEAGNDDSMSPLYLRRPDAELESPKT